MGSFPKKIQRPSQTLKQPGKLNLKSFAIVNEALARMNLGDSNDSNLKDNRKFLLKPSTKVKPTQSRLLEHAPLAAPEDGDSAEEYEEAEYEQINDGFSEAVNNIASQLFTYSAQDQGSMRSKLRQRREKEQQRKERYKQYFLLCSSLGRLNFRKKFRL